MSKHDSDSSAAEVAESLLSKVSTGKAQLDSQQMDEMIQLLRNIATEKKPNDTNRHPFIAPLLLRERFLTQFNGCMYRFQCLDRKRSSRLPIPKFLSANKFFILFCMILYLIHQNINGPSDTLSSGVSTTPKYSTTSVESNKKPIKKGINSSFVKGGTSTSDLYYNSRPGKENKALPLSKELHPPGGPAICILVNNQEKDISELQTALRSLEFLQGDIDSPSPVLIFNEGDLSDESITLIRTSTDRPIAFPLVDFTLFPDGFDPETETSWYVPTYSKWGYHQMIRFFDTLIWEHPAIERFETIMRIDSDSCFKEVNSYLPLMKNDAIVYHSQFVGHEHPSVPNLEGLYEFTKEYLKTIERNPGNPVLWDYIETTMTFKKSLPVFRTNAEISRKSFMQSGDLTSWHHALSEEEPFGVFRDRWGDAVTRFLEVVMFASADEIFTSRFDGYFHQQGCSWPEVESALMKYKDRDDTI